MKTKKYYFAVWWRKSEFHGKWYPWKTQFYTTIEEVKEDVSQSNQEKIGLQYLEIDINVPDDVDVILWD